MLPFIIFLEGGESAEGEQEGDASKSEDSPPRKYFKVLLSNHFSYFVIFSELKLFLEIFDS